MAARKPVTSRSVQEDDAWKAEMDRRVSALERASGMVVPFGTNVTVEWDDNRKRWMQIVTVPRRRWWGRWLQR